MDYFEDLLESYGRLKKRTFKLRYINEGALSDADPQAIQAAEQQATEFIGRSLSNTYTNNPPENPYAYYAKKTDTIALTLNGRNYGTVANKSGSLEKNTKGYEKLVAHFLDSNQAIQVEDQAKDIANTPGATLAAVYEEDPAVTKDLEDTIANINAFCASFSTDELRRMSKETAERRVCTLEGRANAKYITAGNETGFEYKIANGLGVSKDDTGQEIITGELAGGLVKEVVDSQKELSKFMAGEGNCANIASKVGEAEISKERHLILYDREGNNGVAMKANSLQLAMLNRVKEKCSGIDLQREAKRLFSQNEKNAIKGTMHEVVFQSLVQLMVDPEANLPIIKKRLKEQAKILESIHGDMGDVARDFESFFEYSQITEQYGIVKDAGKLKEFLSTEMGYLVNFTKLMDADGVLEAGGDLAQGDRADTVMLYNDRAKAEEKAKLVGAEVLEIDGKFGIGVGQKRLSEFKKVTLGSIGNARRAGNLMTPGFEDKNLAKGFLESIDKGMGLSPDQSKDASDYYNDVEKQIQEFIKPLTDKQKTYIDGKGKIKTVKPADTAKLIYKNLADKIDPNLLDQTSLVSMAKTVMGGDTSESSVAALREASERYLRFAMYKRDIAAGNENAKACLVKQTAIAGYNVNDIAQSVVEDSGNHYTFSHNQLMNDVFDAFKSGDMEIDIDLVSGGKLSSRAVIKTQAGQAEKYLVFSQRRSWGSKAKKNANSESVVEARASVIKRIAKNMNTKALDNTSESKLNQFLHQQLELITELLKE